MRINGRRFGAHRIAWHLATGAPLEGDYVVRHVKCRNTLCCNPRHLASGTYADNSADMVRDGMSTRGEKATRGKLTANQVRAIRAAHAAGATEASLAREYGVAQSSMWAVLQRKSWAWLDA